MKTLPRVTTNGAVGTQAVLVVDDHPLVREGLLEVFAEQADFTVAGEARTGAEARRALARLRPELMVLDLALPDGHGLELIKDIRAQSKRPGILVFSLYEESVYGLRAMRAGANGYVMKSEPMSRLVEALRAIAAGQLAVSPAVSNQLIRQCVGSANGRGDGATLAPLTDRELQVFELMGRGAGTREIASFTHRSDSAVEACRVRIREKLRLKNCAEALYWAVQWTEYGKLSVA